MILTIDSKSIYKITPSKSCDYLQEMFQVLPPELNVFAKYKVGAGYFQWTLDGEEWLKLSDADTMDAKDVTDALIDIKSQVRNIPNFAVIADNIFTTPGSEFIFYKYSEGNLKIGLVAWDYKFPAGPLGGTVKVSGPSVQKRQNVKLSFTEAGQPAADFPFSFFTYSGRERQVKTDDNGCWTAGEFLPGRVFQFKVNGSDMKITVEKGKEEYLFDVTRPYSLSVQVNLDGNPLSGKNVSVEYMGGSQKLETGTDGLCRTELPYAPSGSCSVSVGESSKSITLNYPDTFVNFDFKTQYADISVSLLLNGKPLADERINIICGEKALWLTSDVHGKASASVPFKQNTTVKVTVKDESKENALELDGNEFQFYFYKDILISPQIQVFNEKGEKVPFYPLVVDVDGVIYNVETKQDGCCIIPEQKVGKQMKVTDLSNYNNSLQYELIESQQTYDFFIESPITRQIEFTVQDNSGAPISNKSMKLEQNGKTSVLNLDSNGYATLDDDIYNYGETVKCTLLDDSDSTPFEFMLDKDEYVYIIEFSRTVRKAWWTLLFEILLVLLILAMIVFFWSVICAFLS